jgi:hypothetical protein
MRLTTFPSFADKEEARGSAARRESEVSPRTPRTSVEGDAAGTLPPRNPRHARVVNGNLSATLPFACVPPA